MLRSFIAAFLLVGLPLTAAAQDLRLPNQSRSVKFGVMGDTGQPGSGQRGDRQTDGCLAHPIPVRVRPDDGRQSLWQRESRRDYQQKFEIPYSPLLDAGVKFYAALGNHDDDGQILYKPFNMGGKKSYSFKPANGVRFFALDSQLRRR